MELHTSTSPCAGEPLARELAHAHSLAPFRPWQRIHASRHAAELCSWCGIVVVRFRLCAWCVCCRAQGAKEIVRRYVGQYFGEFALLSDAPRSATVSAVTVCKVSQVGTCALDSVQCQCFPAQQATPTPPSDCVEVLSLKGSTPRDCVSTHPSPPPCDTAIPLACARRGCGRYTLTPPGLSCLWVVSAAAGVIARSVPQAR